MRKMNGGIRDYNIKEVLGRLFKQFITLVDNKKDFEPFLFKHYSQMEPAEDLTLKTKPEPNDIHYEYSEFIMAVAAAFKELESPAYGKGMVVDKYSSEVYKIYDDLIAGKSTGALTPKNKKLDLKQFPYSHNSAIKYLSPGLHFISPKSMSYFAEGDNDLANAIYYLQFFISLLDVDNLSGRDVVNFLKQDNLYFNNYAKGITDLISSGRYFTEKTNIPTREVIQNAVYDGLTAVSNKIINKIKGLSTGAALNFEYAKIYKERFASHPDKNFYYTNFFTVIGLDPKIASQIDDYFTNLIPLQGQGKSVSSLGLNPDELKTHAINGLYNPSYLLGKDIATKKIVGTPATGNEVFSLDNLYGLPITKGAGEVTYPYQTLITNPEQGQADGTLKTDANLVDNLNVKLVDENIVKPIYEGKFDLTTNPNPLGAFLGFARYAIENNNADLSEKIPPQSDIIPYMNQALEAIGKFNVRINSLFREEDPTKNLAEYRDEFVLPLSNYAGRYMAESSGELSRISGPLEQGKQGILRPSAQSPPAKNNLSDPIIKDFYLEVVVKDVPFYDKFFNLIKTTTPDKYRKEIPLAEAATVPDAELQNYRLNVKKEKGRELMVGGQFGGAPGDMVFLRYISEYPTDGSVGSMWLSQNERIPREKLVQAGADAVRNVVRIIYDANPSQATVNIYGFEKNPVEVARRAGRIGSFHLNFPLYYQHILDQIALGKDVGVSARWKEHEARLTEHVLKSCSQWTKEGDHFIRKDPETGKNVDSVVADTCSLINIGVSDCIDFLTQCVASNEEPFPDACRKLFSFEYETKFEFNPPMDVLKEKVCKINPEIAFGILQKFKFKSYLAEVDTPIKGMRSFKVQSVDSWLQQLFNGQADDCTQPTVPAFKMCDGRSLKEQLGPVSKELMELARNPKYYPFFNYLDALVEWVNANPQVLNPEETGTLDCEPKTYPEINKSFITYDYQNPYRQISLRLRSMACGLDRLKSSIMSELAGTNAPAMISNIATIPLGIEMPLNRSMFANPVPITNILPMRGGHIQSVEQELKNINEQFGYNLFNLIYGELLGVMTTMGGKKQKPCDGSGRYGKSIKLKEEDAAKIRDKLEKFRKLEEELRKSLAGLIARNRLYHASSGYIDAFGVPEKNLEAVLMKHSNLLHLGAAYNKRAINLIDLFQTISKAVQGKLDEACQSTQTPQQKVLRPLTMGYATGPF